MTTSIASGSTFTTTSNGEPLVGVGIGGGSVSLGVGGTGGGLVGATASV